MTERGNQGQPAKWVKLSPVEEVARIRYVEKQIMERLVKEHVAKAIARAAVGTRPREAE